MALPLPAGVDVASGSLFASLLVLSNVVKTISSQTAPPSLLSKLNRLMGAAPSNQIGEYQRRGKPIPRLISRGNRARGSGRWRRNSASMGPRLISRGNEQHDFETRTAYLSKIGPGKEALPNLRNPFTWDYEQDYTARAAKQASSPNLVWYESEKPDETPTRCGIRSKIKQMAFATHPSTAAERARRLRIYEEALASARLEGFELDEPVKALYQRYIHGQMTLAEVGSVIDGLNDREFDPRRRRL